MDLIQNVSRSNHFIWLAIWLQVLHHMNLAKNARPGGNHLTSGLYRTCAEQPTESPFVADPPYNSKVPGGI